MGISKFSDTLDLLKGFIVNLYVGEEVYKGKLIGVEADHIILENENNYIFYYSIDQVQAITKNTKQFQGEEITSTFIKTQSLTEVLDSFKHSWVTIICVNKQKFNGVLSHVDEDFATLISGEERILIKLTQISNIFKGFINENNESDSNKAENNNSEDNKRNKNEKHSEASASKSIENVRHKVESSDSYKPEQTEVAIKVVTNESEAETRVWSQSIKNVTDKLNEVATHKNTNDIKKSKEDTVQNSKNAEKQKENKQTIVSEDKNIRQKVEKQTIQKEGKQAIQNEEKQVIQKGSKETKEVKGSQKQVLKAQVNDVKESSVNNVKDVMRPVTQKQPTSDKKDIPQPQHKQEEVKQKEQPIRTFRFAGEPTTATREIEKSSIFAGWPNRRNRTRF